MSPRLILASAAALVAFGATSVFAHHGWTGYDEGKTMTLTGSISRIYFGNPHVQIDLKGSDKAWNVVLAPPARMQMRGLPEGSLKTGDTVSVIGYAHRGSPNELRAEQIVVASKTIEMR